MKKIHKLLFSFTCLLSLTLPFTNNLFPQKFAAADSENATIVLAASDFQHPSGPNAGKNVMNNILSVMESDGITSADGFLFCGDYDYDTYANPTQTADGVNAVKNVVSSIIKDSDNIVLAQGNHDTAIETSGMSASGDNDPQNGAYGVFVINEDDYMRTNNDKGRVQETAQVLAEYLNDKLAQGFENPIFIVSHLPLHYTGRTTQDGDGQYAHYIFDVLNEAGEKGLDIFFLYGHNHSNGWEDYLGGASVFMSHGDEILVPQGTKNKADCSKETLHFTSMNAGYVGYFSGTQGVDSTLSMSAFKITDDIVTVVRYDQNGIHDLKSAGVSSDASIVNKKTYASPQIITLQKITDNSPVKDVIAVNKIGNQYKRIESVSQIINGNKYLLVSNANSTAFALPSIVTKSNSSGSARTGLDLEPAENVGWSKIYGEYSTKEWSFIAKNGGWLLSNGEKYLKLTATENYGVTATFDDEGDIFTIEGSGSAFTFTSGNYVLNYNSRNLINGYESSPTPFTIYELSGHLVDIINGFASVNGKTTDVAKKGQTIQITAPKRENMDFVKWTIQEGEITLKNENAETTEFVMPSHAVSITAQYAEHIHNFNQKFASPEYLKDGTSNLYYTSCACGDSSKDTANEQLFGAYRILEGKNGVWENNTQKDGLIFQTNANEDLSAIKINNNVIASNAYTVANDGKITLLASHLNELESGTYKIRFIYEFGECSTTFIITKTETPPVDSGNQDSSEIDKEPQPSIPSSPDDGSTSNNDNSTVSSGCGSSVTACSILFILLFPLPFLLRKKSRK